MKSIYKYLIPPFLRRCDVYLLERYPLIWRTGIHLVGFYGLIGTVLLFGSGFLYPVHRNGTNWVVNPIRPIEFGHDELYIYSLMLIFVVTLGSLVNRQILDTYPFFQAKYTFTTLIIYIFCYYLLMGFTASAFRWGTIVHTAYFWMKDADLHIFKKSDVYPYGFVFLSEDTIGVPIPVDTLQYFQLRRNELKRIWKKEAEILQHKYDLDQVFWDSLFERAKKNKQHLYESNQLYSSYKSYQLYRSHQSYKSYKSYFSYLSDISYNSDIRNLGSLSYGSDLSYGANLSTRSYRSYRSDRLDRSNWSIRLDRWYRSYRLDRSNELDSLDRLYLSYLSIYASKSITSNKIEKLFSTYRFDNKFDTLYYKPIFTMPNLPYMIEDAVRAVEHAREYIDKRVFLQHFVLLLHYLVLLALLLFFMPFVSLSSIVQVSMLSFLTGGVLYLFEIQEIDLVAKKWLLLNASAYLILPFTGLGALLWMLVKKKQYSYFEIFNSMILLGLIWTLVGALINPIEEFSWISPVDVAFYGIQVIGLIAAFIIPYIQAMPKRS